MKRAKITAGDNVLIVGGGPVGLSVAVWCKCFGARHIIVNDLIADRAEQAVDFGATGFLDSPFSNVPVPYEKIVGSPPSIIFDAVGVAGSMQLLIDYISNYGKVVVVGPCMVSDRAEPATAVVKEVEIIFCFCHEHADLQMTLEMLAQEHIDVKGLVTESVRFEKFPETFERLKQPSDQIKVMLKPH